MSVMPPGCSYEHSRIAAVWHAQRTRKLVTCNSGARTRDSTLCNGCDWPLTYSDPYPLPQNAEIFTLTYGSIVRQLIEDFEDLDEVNKQLDAM